MRKRISLVFSVLALYAILLFAGCKKSSPSVVGNWQVKDFTFIYTGYTNAGEDSGISTTNYNVATNTITTYLYRSNLAPFYDTTRYNFKNSYWNIQSNGNYTITENADNLGTTTTGTWDYLSNTNTNSGITFNLCGSFLMSLILTNGSPCAFNIQSLSSNQLVLSYTSSTADSTGSFLNKNATITFTR